MNGDYTYEQAKAAMKAANPKVQLSEEGKWTSTDYTAFNKFLLIQGTTTHRHGAHPLDPYGLAGAARGFGTKGVAAKWIVDLLTADSEDEATGEPAAEPDTDPTELPPDGTEVNTGEGEGAIVVESIPQEVSTAPEPVAADEGVQEVAEAPADEAKSDEGTGA